MNIHYPFISQFQQFVELKDYPRSPKRSTSAMSASWPSTSHFRCDPATLTENQQREYFLFLRQHKLREFTSRQFSQPMSVGPVLMHPAKPLASIDLKHD
jgi:hypothetical protein